MKSFIFGKINPKLYEKIFLEHDFEISKKEKFLFEKDMFCVLKDYYKYNDISILEYIGILTYNNFHIWYLRYLNKLKYEWYVFYLETTDKIYLELDFNILYSLSKIDLDCLNLYSHQDKLPTEIQNILILK